TADAYGIPPPRVVRNGRRQGAPREPAEPASLVFTAGRLWDEGKNLAALDRAAARLDVPVLAAGPLAGPNGAMIALPHTHALGELGGEDMQAWLARRPIFASVPRYEPFGLPGLAATHAGRAAVPSAIPTLRELRGGP